MHPVLLNIFGLKIYSYGAMIGLGFVLAVTLAAFRAKREGIEPARILDFSFYVLLAGIFGAKIPLFFKSPGYYLKSFGNFVTLLRSGGVILAGIISAMIVAVLYFRKHKLDPWRMLDIAAPSIILGQAIGRIGCFLAGCCWGKVCFASWAVTFTDPAAGRHTGVHLNTPLHPVQLYNSVANFAIFAILILLFSRRKFIGHVFLSYIFLYSISRFTTEFFRGDLSRITIGPPFSDAQYISIVGFISAIVLFYLKIKKEKKKKE